MVDDCSALRPPQLANDAAQRTDASSTLLTLMRSSLLVSTTGPCARAF
jgi:hypothetical protein